MGKKVPIGPLPHDRFVPSRLRPPVKEKEEKKVEKPLDTFFGSLAKAEESIMVEVYKYDESQDDFWRIISTQIGPSREELLGLKDSLQAKYGKGKYKLILSDRTGKRTETIIEKLGTDEEEEEDGGGGYATGVSPDYLFGGTRGGKEKAEMVSMMKDVVSQVMKSNTQQITTLQNQLQNLQSTNIRRMPDSEPSHLKDEIERLRSDMNKIEKESDKKLQEIRNTNREEKEKIRSDHEKEITKLREDYRREEERLKEEKSVIQMQAKEDAHKQEMEALNKKFDAQIQQMSNQLQTKEPSKSEIDLNKIMSSLFALKAGTSSGTSSELLMEKLIAMFQQGLTIGQTGGGGGAYPPEQPQKEWKDVLMSITEGLAQRIPPETITQLATLLVGTGAPIPTPAQIQQTKQTPTVLAQPQPQQQPGLETQEIVETEVQPEFSEKDLVEKGFYRALCKLNEFVDEYPAVQASQMFSGFITGEMFTTWIGEDPELAFNNMIQIKPELNEKKDKVMVVLKELLKLYKGEMIEVKPKKKTPNKKTPKKKINKKK